MSQLEMKSISLSVRLTESERADLEVKANKIGCTISGYIRRILDSREIKQSVISQVDRDTHRELAHLKVELIRQGINLNQLARVANSSEEIPPGVTLQLQALMEINQQLQTDISICKVSILGRTDDREN
jgi:Bacterial mobilisation protein (MobC)